MIQVIAYDQTNESPVYLDIKEGVNISVNYSFADIKDPSSRNASYSHTFKLPFSNTNNQFFKDIYEVNIDTTDGAVSFNPKIGTKATISVDTVHQLTGKLQLKNILVNAKLYEVVIFGEGADLFTSIKDKKLIDAFRDISDGITLDTTWNHNLNYASVVNSWSGNLVNLDGDTVADIMYPIVDYAQCQNDLFADIKFPYLAVDSGIGVQQTSSFFKDMMISPGHLKPAIRIKTIFQQIIAKAGFSYTSTFIDGSYFDDIFMLLGTENEGLITNPIGGCKIGLTGNTTITGQNSNIFNKQDTDDFYDVDEVYSTGLCTYFTQVPGNYKWAYRLKLTTTASGLSTTDFIKVRMGIKVNGQLDVNNTHSADVVSSSNQTMVFTGEFDNLVITGASTIQFNVLNMSEDNSGAVVPITLQAYVGAAELGCFIELIGSEVGFEGRDVFVPDNMPDIDQEAFMKDLIQRFNLVIVPNPETDKNLLIEPFNDYIDDGSSKDWEQKLDKSKEVQIKFTNDIIPSNILFTDLEDEDTTNDYHFRTYNKVYGEYEKKPENSEFATKELTNESIYSPFIPKKLYELENTVTAEGFDNFLIHRSYSTTEGEIKCVTTKPKLFHYNGLKAISAMSSSTYSIFNGIAETVNTHNTYPYCSNFNASPVTSTTKDLRWGGGWSYEFLSPMIQGVYTSQNLFEVYWSRYINEIYSDDSRIMTCFVKLTEYDINDFNFNDKIFIHNCFWRVNKITNYQVGQNVSTKIEFIKIIQKNVHDCDAIPSTFNANGSISFISATDGSSVSATQECCNVASPQYFWNPILNQCRWKQLWGTSPPKIPTSKTNANNILKTGNAGSGNVHKSYPDSTKVSTIDKTTKATGSTINLTYIGQTEDGTLTEIFIEGNTGAGINAQRFQVPFNSFCTMLIVMSSIQSGLDNNTGAIGESSMTQWQGAIKNVNGTVSMVGTARSNGTDLEDSGVGKRDLTMTALNTGGNSALVLKVQAEANKRVQYVVKVEITQTDYNLYNTNAIWMDDNNFVFQDGDQMLWN